MQRNSTRVASAAAALALLVGVAPRASAQAPLAGTQWWDEDRTIHIGMEQGSDGAIRGRIVWMKEPTDSLGRPNLDTKNADPARRADPILGLVMLQGMRADGERRWADGSIYDARNGKTYRSSMELVHPDTLKVRGYVKVGFVKFGRTATWVRVAPGASE